MAQERTSLASQAGRHKGCATAAPLQDSIASRGLQAHRRRGASPWRLPSAGRSATRACPARASADPERPYRPRCGRPTGVTPAHHRADRAHSQGVFTSEARGAPQACMLTMIPASGAEQDSTQRGSGGAAVKPSQYGTGSRFGAPCVRPADDCKQLAKPLATLPQAAGRPASSSS